MSSMSLFLLIEMLAGEIVTACILLAVSLVFACLSCLWFCVKVYNSGALRRDCVEGIRLRNNRLPFF